MKTIDTRTIGCDGSTPASLHAVIREAWSNLCESAVERREMEIEEAAGEYFSDEQWGVTDHFWLNAHEALVKAFHSLAVLALFSLNRDCREGFDFEFRQDPGIAFDYIGETNGVVVLGHEGSDRTYEDCEIPASQMKRIADRLMKALEDLN